MGQRNGVTVLVTSLNLLVREWLVGWPAEGLLVLSGMPLGSINRLHRTQLFRDELAPQIAGLYPGKTLDELVKIVQRWFYNDRNRNRDLWPPTNSTTASSTKSGGGAVGGSGTTAASQKRATAVAAARRSPAQQPPRSSQHAAAHSPAAASVSSSPTEHTRQLASPQSRAAPSGRGRSSPAATAHPGRRDYEVGEEGRGRLLTD